MYIPALFLLFLNAVASGLQQTSNPPQLDVPTYSLATFNRDGTTNMNIITYATPVSSSPNRVWSLGVYRETLTEENLLRKPVAVLQLLTTEHVPLIDILGGKSGRDVNKKEACSKVGFTWLHCDEFQGLDVIPGCASYLFLTVQGGLLDAGSHLIVPFCQVESMYTSGDDMTSSAHLKTSRLRDLGVITEQGRVADVQNNLANRDFRLQ